MNHLSESAAALLDQRLAGERVEVTEASRPLYRELVAAGMMMPLHTFARGNEGAYRLTEAACDLRDGVIAPASPLPSSRAVPWPRG